MGNIGVFQTRPRGWPSHPSQGGVRPVLPSCCGGSPFLLAVGCWPFLGLGLAVFSCGWRGLLSRIGGWSLLKFGMGWVFDLPSRSVGIDPSFLRPGLALPSWGFWRNLLWLGWALHLLIPMSFRCVSSRFIAFHCSSFQILSLGFIGFSQTCINFIKLKSLSRHSGKSTAESRATHLPKKSPSRPTP